MISDDDKWALQESEDAHKSMQKVFQQILDRHAKMLLSESVMVEGDLLKIALKKAKYDGMKEFVNEYNALYKRLSKRP